MNQRALRTLVLWVIWASTALVVYITLYRGTAVWEFIGQDPSRITWLILGMFLFGVASSFLLALRLTLETVRAHEIQKAAEQGGLNGIDTGRGHRAVNRFFIALKETVARDGQPDVDALLHTELSTYQRVSHTIEVVGNLLITLGLIGTVMGLTLTLTGLTSSLDALGHDQEILLAGLRKAMAGMGTAFYTTLLGAVLGGVILRVFAQITEHGVHSLFDFLMRVCLVHCSADYKPSVQREFRFLNQEIAELEGNLAAVQRAFLASREAMEAFRKDVAALNRRDAGPEQDSLEEAIRRHRKYCEVLREELHLINCVNNSWWARLKAILGFRV